MRAEQRHLFKATAAFLAAAMVPSAARADEPPTGAEDVETLTKFSLEELLAMPVWKVTAASKREESAGDAPATVFVVTKDDIYVRGYSTLVDVLKDLPGMDVAEYTFAPFTGGTEVAVRGVPNTNKLIVLVNGMRTNPPGGDPIALRSDFSVRQAEEIEVIYGPGSTLYGQDAINGIINIKTKQAGGEHWIDVGAGVGYPWRHESWLGLARKIGETAISGYFQYSDATLTNRKEEYPDEWATYLPSYAISPGGPAIMDNPKRWDRGLNGFLQLSQGNFSTQLWHRQSWRNTSEGQAGWPFVDEAKWTDVATVADAKYNFQLAENVSLSSALTFNRYQVLPESTIILPAGPMMIKDHRYSMQTGVTFEETVSAKIGQRISLLGGLLYGHYDVMPQGTVPAGLDTNRDISSQAGTLDYYTTQGDPSSKVSIPLINNIVYQNIGLYAEGTVKLHDRLRALVGLRLDKDERYAGTPISPRVALIANPIPDLALKAIYTEAFVQPAAASMYNVYFAGAFFNTTNPDLKPERARSFELNAVLRRDNAMASVSGYYNTQRDLLLTGVYPDALTVSPAVYPSPDPGAPSFPLHHDANGGTSRAYGGEAFGRYSLLRNRVTVWGSYSYVDLELRYISNGAEVKSTPAGLSNHNFRLGTSISIIPSRLFATLSFWLKSTPQNVSNFRGDNVTAAQTTTLRGPAEWPYEASLNLICRLGLGAEAFASLKNITNHHYATVGSGTAYPGETFRGIVGLRFTK